MIENVTSRRRILVSVLGLTTARAISHASSAVAESDDVQFVSANEESSKSDRFDVDKPANVQKGDVLIMTIGGTANGDDGMPYEQEGRWTRINLCSQDDNGEGECVEDGQDLFLHMYYTVATDDEPDEYDVNSGGNSVASITAYRGVNTDSPVQSTRSLVNDGDADVSTCPPTDGVDGGMLLCGITQDDQLYLENHDELTLRSVGENPDSTTTVLTKSLNSDGDTDRHEVDIVDPTGNKDISMSVVLRPSSADGDDGGSEEGVHTIDDSTVKAVWKPDFDVYWSDYVYVRSSVNGDPRAWQLMDETSDNVFETTFGGLSAGDELEYQFSYYDDGWQYTDAETYTFDLDDDSGPETNRLVYGESNELQPGEKLESATGDYRLYFQGSDGNLVLRDANTWDALWASGTAGADGAELKLQGDGNLVVYTDGGDPVWASNTAGSGADELVLENDGALVLYDDGAEVWSVND